jgi:uncharacterized protein
MAQKTLSLQEQLLKAGLATEAKAKQVKSEKHKEAKLQKHNNVQRADEAAQKAQQAKVEQLAKDQALAALQKQQAEQKAIVAQIRQLVEANRKPHGDEDGVAYRFIDKNKVKVIYVGEATREALIKGKLAIIRLGKQYELVPLEVAEKIRQRDASYVVLVNIEAAKPQDDAYAAYQVPDDLMW